MVWVWKCEAGGGRRRKPETVTASFTEIARAKVNLTLRVLGRRPDGYHDLDSIAAFADCADSQTLEPGDLGLAVTGPGSAACGAANDNLVIRAARLLAERVPELRLGLFTLDKHLPVAAGVGGGSADAAAALRLLARANDIALDDARLFEVARLAGADVPVCIASHACVMGGVGDDEFLEAVTLPKSGASAADWIIQLSGGVNDLEAPALRVQPVIGEVLAALRKTQGVQLARMSGSGATCFALYADVAAAERAAQSITLAHPEWWVHAGTLS